MVDSYILDVESNSTAFSHAHSCIKSFFRVENAALRTSSIKSDTSLSLTLTDLHCPTEASEQPESRQSKAPDSLMSSNRSYELRRY